METSDLKNKGRKNEREEEREERESRKAAKQGKEMLFQCAPLSLHVKIV
jgi:hypothetical protein